MIVSYYCPNKHLNHPEPSGDRTIARGLGNAMANNNCNWFEASTFGSRSSTNYRHWPKAFFSAWFRCIKHKPDIWLTYHSYYKSPDLIGPTITRLRKIPYAIFQPMYSTKVRKNRKTENRYHLNRFALEHIDLAFTNNRLDIPGLKRIIPENKIHYIPPGIYPEDFIFIPEETYRIHRQLSPNGHPLLLATARFREGVKTQSLLFLLRALQYIKEPFQLVIIGDGPTEQLLKKQAAPFGNRVRFLGRIERAHLAPYYSAADIFTFPGIGESLGMVFLEAQCCRTPVVALNSEGVFQVVENNRTGFLVNNEIQYADAITRLIKEKTIRKTMENAGEKFVKEQRNLHINYKKFIEILKHFVEKKQ